MAFARKEEEPPFEAGVWLRYGSCDIFCSRLSVAD